ncbi:MAG: hypothetical protein IH571_00250 [Acholeplasmataceae bacterium]|nr:hypothetical protein [Acholeplasmataceae bacterium]
MYKTDIAPETIAQVLEDLSQHELAQFIFTGSTMSPFFKDQKTVVTLIKPNRAYHKYDVVLFQTNGRYRLHRIQQIKHVFAVISGDRSRVSEVIRTEEIIGLVESFETKGKKTSSDSKGYLFNVRLLSFIKPIRRFLFKFTLRKN